MRYLHTRRGAEADVAATWRGVLGGRARVLLREDAIADGLFGPVEAEHVTRIGDVVVICTDAETVVLATDREPPEVAKLIGFHGSTTDARDRDPADLRARRVSSPRIVLRERASAPGTSQASTTSSARSAGSMRSSWTRTAG